MDHRAKYSNDNVDTITTRVDRHVEECLGLIAKQGSASFAALNKLLRDRGLSTEGNYAFCLDSRPNSILWCGLSREAHTVIKKVMVSSGVEIEGTQLLTYILEGTGVELPVGSTVEAATGNDFAVPTWVPSVLVLRRTE